MIVKYIKLKLVCNLDSVELVFRGDSFVGNLYTLTHPPKNANLFTAEITPMLFSVFKCT